MPTPPQPELGHRRDKEGCPSDHCHGEDDNGEGEDGDDGDDSDGDEDDKDDEDDEDDDKNDEEEGFAQ